MPAPPPELAARLAALSPSLPGRAARWGATVRRLSGDLPVGDLLWLDRLHAAGDLTEYQLAALAAGRDKSLRIGPFSATGAPGFRTRTAMGTAGPAALKACGPRTEHLEHLCRVDPGRPAIVAPRALVEDGAQCWVRSRLVGGPTLAARVAARGRFEPAEALRLARTLAGGLAAAEAAGLIHGEIHAHNVRLSPAGPALVDCGVAPLLPPRSAETTRGGWAEPVAGPPSFGTEADLRAFAMTLWGALAGRPPFLLAPRRFGTVGVDGPDLPPIAEVAPETPAALAELIDALVGHRPDAAPASFAEVVERLKPTRAPVSPVRSGAWAIACGFALAGIVGAGGLEVEEPVRLPAKPQAVAEEVVSEPIAQPAPPAVPVPAVRRVAVPQMGR